MGDPQNYDITLHHKSIIHPFDRSSKNVSHEFIAIDRRRSRLRKFIHFWLTYFFLLNFLIKSGLYSDMC